MDERGANHHVDREKKEGQDVDSLSQNHDNTKPPKQKYIITRNSRRFASRQLGRFAPIFYLNCKHVLFVYILKQRRKNFCVFLKKKSRIFKKNLKPDKPNLYIDNIHEMRILSYN